MSKFERKVARIMTADEARAKCVEMGLHESHPGAVEFIVDEFERLNARSDEDHDDRCDCGNASHECESTTGEDGKIACGMDWEGAYERLGRAMGLTEDEAFQSLSEPEEFPLVESVWDAFFQE